MGGGEGRRPPPAGKIRKMGHLFVALFFARGASESLKILIFNEIIFQRKLYEGTQNVNPPTPSPVRNLTLKSLKIPLKNWTEIKSLYISIYISNFLYNSIYLCSLERCSVTELNLYYQWRIFELS